MGRPRKQTVEYFNHDVFASEGKTLTIIKGQFGLAGMGFWWELLAILGRTEGHYFDARKEDDLEFLTRKIGTDIVSGAEILDKLAKLEAIDPILWQHRVIWCQNFVDRLGEVYVKRQSPKPLKPCFCDGNCNHIDTNGVISVTETPIPEAETPHTTVKETTVNNSRGNNTTVPPVSPPQETSSDGSSDTPIFKLYHQEVLLNRNPTDLEVDSFKDFEKTYGEEKLREAIKILSKGSIKTPRYLEGILKRIDDPNTPRAGPGAKCNEDPDKYIKGKYGHVVQR